MSGMNVARINLSHGDRDSHSKAIELVRKARRSLGTFTAILLDTRGPEIRVNDLAEPVKLEKGMVVTITGEAGECNANCLTVNYPGLAGDLHPGNRILLDDGKLALQVNAIEGGKVQATVLVGGTLSSRKRVSLPDSEVNLPSLSQKDMDDIAISVGKQMDFIAASFVRRANDV